MPMPLRAAQQRLQERLIGGLLAAAEMTWLLAQIGKKRSAVSDIAGASPDEPFAPERLAA
jgi:hypothetical protein